MQRRSGGNIASAGPEKPVNTAVPVEVSVTTSTARSAQLTAGWYIITTNADVFWLQGNSSVDALTTSRRLWNGTYRLVYVTGTDDDYIAAITAVGTATLSIEKVS